MAGANGWSASAWPGIHSCQVVSVRRQISLSGFASAGDFQRTREAGFDAHVGKPFDATALAAALQGALTGVKRGQPAA